MPGVVRVSLSLERRKEKLYKLYWREREESSEDGGQWNTDKRRTFMSGEESSTHVNGRYSRIADRFVVFVALSEDP